jgi:hypothetical protein
MIFSKKLSGDRKATTRKGVSDDLARNMQTFSFQLWKVFNCKFLHYYPFGHAVGWKITAFRARFDWRAILSLYIAMKITRSLLYFLHALSSQFVDVVESK